MWKGSGVSRTVRQSPETSSTSILTSGKASRLYRELVDGRQIATRVWAANPSERLGGSFHGQRAVANAGHREAELEAAVNPVIEEVRAHGVTAEEVARVQRVIAPRACCGASSGSAPTEAKRTGSAAMRCFSATRATSPRTWPATVRSLSPLVQAFAQRYLLPDEQVILDVEPAPPGRAPRAKSAAGAKMNHARRRLPAHLGRPAPRRGRFAETKRSPQLARASRFPR